MNNELECPRILRAIACNGVFGCAILIISQALSGAWSGEQMFQMKARLLVPPTLDTDELRAGLESLANELMVDITIDDGHGA